MKTVLFVCLLLAACGGESSPADCPPADFIYTGAGYPASADCPAPAASETAS